MCNSNEYIITECMAKLIIDRFKIIDIGNAYSKVKKELEALYKDWEVVAMEIEGL